MAPIGQQRAAATQALGHPAGATGAITIKAVIELERVNAKRALITMCIGAGQAIALAIERL